MHIILGILGSIATIFFLVRRIQESGFDIGWLNPFSWARRRAWRKKYHADPIFSIQSPLEAAATLMYVAAKFSGEISLEEKQFLLTSFEKDFKLTHKAAVELLSSCAFLIKDEDKILNKLDDFLKPSLGSFNNNQIESTLALVHSTIHLSQSPTQKQLSFFNQLKKVFNLSNQHESW